MNIQTFTSPYLHSPNADAYAEDAQAQHDVIQFAVRRFLQDPFEAGEDLRGALFKVYVHEDGLHVTITHSSGVDKTEFQPQTDPTTNKRRTRA